MLISAEVTAFFGVSPHEVWTPGSRSRHRVVDPLGPQVISDAKLIHLMSARLSGLVSNCIVGETTRIQLSDAVLFPPNPAELSMSLSLMNVSDWPSRFSL